MLANPDIHIDTYVYTECEWGFACALYSSRCRERIEFENIGCLFRVEVKIT